MAAGWVRTRQQTLHAPAEHGQHRVQSMPAFAPTLAKLILEEAREEVPIRMGLRDAVPREALKRLRHLVWYAISMTRGTKESLHMQ